MHLLPPSPKPFGIFADKSAELEDLKIAQELERQIVTALWEQLFEKYTFDLQTKDEATYTLSFPITVPFPMKYISVTLDLSDGTSASR